MAQEPQLVGHAALALSQEPCRLLLGKILGPHQRGNAHSLLHKVQILPLEIFYQGGNTGLLVVHLQQDAGHFRQSRLGRRPKPPLPGDELIAPCCTPNGQWLQHPMGPDGFCQLVQGFRPKHPPRLHGIGPDSPDGQKDDPPGLHIGLQLLALHCPSSPGKRYLLF